MKRQTKPYFKKSHRAFYVNLNGKPIRLASEAEGHEKAMEAYFRVMAGCLPPSDDLTVAVLMHRFIASHEHSPPGTRRFYTRPCRSFLDYIGAALRVSEAAPYHVETWLRECHAFKRLPGGKRSDQPTSSTYRHNLVRGQIRFLLGRGARLHRHKPRPPSQGAAAGPQGRRSLPRTGPVGEGRCLRRPDPGPCSTC